MIILVARRQRLERQRTQALLRRTAALGQELAGSEADRPDRPRSGAALTAWRRREVCAYLALPPWSRAWRTSVSWSRLRRVAAAGRIVVEQAAADAYGGRHPAQVAHLRDDRYVAVPAPGARATVEVLWSGRSPSGIGAGHGDLVAGPPGCRALAA